MKNLKIFSNENFLLEIDNKNYFLEETKFLEVLNCEKNNLLIKAYPIDQSYLSIPFCINLENENFNVKSQSSCVKVYNFKNRAEIFIKPFLLSSNIIVYTASHTVKNIKYTITCYEDRIKIFSSKGEYVYEVNMINASSFVVDNNINILCNKKNNKSLIAYNVTNNVFSQVDGDQIQIDGNNIKTLQNINDMAKHIKVCSFVQENEILIKEQSLYTKNTQVKNANNNLLVPYNFFEALKVQDMNLARKFLSLNLQQNLKDDQLLGYFGNFEKIGILSLSPLCYTLYSNLNAKDYEISMTDNKISEINEV